MRVSAARHESVSSRWTNGLRILPCLAMFDSITSPPRLLYCRCAYAQAIPQDVKDGVLRHLSDSTSAFDSVADLCEMSARRDPRLKALAAAGPLKIAACHRRAVLWLFHAADAPLDATTTEIVNMRELTIEQAAARLDAPDINTADTAPT